MEHDEHANVLRPGDALNNTYRIVERIGRGGAGEVYRAEHIHLERPVAIKVLKTRYSQDPQFIDMMKRELMHDIAHPGVVRYIDLQFTEGFGGLHFIVMDYVPGPSLEALMGRGAVDEATLAAVAGAVLDGLAACHARNVYHRDISPDNIILRDGDPHGATLIDFGIAQETGSDARTVFARGFTGKYEYAAPEQIDEEPVDARSDFYSLGATLLAAARGAAPAVPASRGQVSKLKAMPLDLSGLSPGLRGFLATLCNPDRAGRPGDTDAARAALAKVTDAPAPGAEAVPAPGVDSFAPPDLAPAALPEEAPRKRDRPGPVPDEENIDNLLFGPDEEPSRGAAPPPSPRAKDAPRGRRGMVLGLVGLLAAAVLAAFVFTDLMAPPPPPVAAPYTLQMAKGADGGTSLEGVAPDETAATTLADALKARLGTATEGEIGIASGAPNDDWAAMATALAGALARLDEGRAALSDSRATLEGVAPTEEDRASALDIARRAAAAFGYALRDGAVSLAPQPVTRAAVEAALSRQADCGPLAPTGPPVAEYAPGSRIAIGGYLAVEPSREALDRALGALGEGVSGDLSGIETLNPAICRLRALLGPTAGGEVALRYRSDLTGRVVEDDLFDPADAPVIDVVVPAGREGHLYAFAADNEHNAFHLIPALGRETNELREMGTVEGDRRIIPIAYPAAEGSFEKPSFAFEEPYGAMIVYALVADAPLFPHLRAELEDARDLSPDLAAAMATQDGVAVASRFLRVRRP